MNNKGFAISGLLYGIFLLFLMILISILSVLVTRINRLDYMTKETSELMEMKEVDDFTTTPSENYTTTVDGYYKLAISSGSTSQECNAYLPKNTLLQFADGYLKYKLENDTTSNKLKCDNNEDIQCNGATTTNVSCNVCPSFCISGDNSYSMYMTQETRDQYCSSCSENCIGSCHDSCYTNIYGFLCSATLSNSYCRVVDSSCRDSSCYISTMTQTVGASCQVEVTGLYK